MALFLRQDDQRSELQKRVGAELQEKLKQQKSYEYEKPANSLEASTHASRHLGIWVTLALLFVAATVFMVVSLN